jgi:hypothetical protein
MADLGVTGLLEMPPAGTLTGIAKRNLKGVELFALNTPDQLEEATEFLQQHGRTASAHRLQAIPPGDWWSLQGRGNSFAPKTSRWTRFCPTTARSGC